ncbi:hypothetical protein DRQ32_03660, partial [bacterium]
MNWMALARPSNTVCVVLFHIHAISHSSRDNLVGRAGVGRAIWPDMILEGKQGHDGGRRERYSPSIARISRRIFPRSGIVLRNKKT